MSKKPVFQFRFNREEDATSFINCILKNSDRSVRAIKPFTGNGVTQDPKAVLVTGTGSYLLDMILEDKCIEECEKLQGVQVTA